MQTRYKCNYPSLLKENVAVLGTQEDRSGSPHASPKKVEINKSLLSILFTVISKYNKI